MTCTDRLLAVSPANLDIGQPEGAPARPVNEMHTLRDYVPVGVLLQGQAQGEHGAEDSQSRGSRIDLYVVDILAGGGAGYADRDRGVESVDSRGVRAGECGRSRVNRDGLDIRSTGSDSAAAPSASNDTEHADQGTNQICSHSLRLPT